MTLPDRRVSAAPCATVPAKNRYSVFGGVLESEVPMDGLRRIDHGAQADWTFRVVPDRPAALEETALGEERLNSRLSLRVFRVGDGGLRAEYTGLGVGEFLISADGTTISWIPGENPPMEHLRWILLGRIMALALYQSGTLCLHGSAVAVGSQAFGLVAPKYHGKSTLAASLVAAGAHLASDDVVAVEAGPPARIRPGVHALRLWDADSQVARLGGRHSMTGNSGKACIDELPASRLMQEPTPLAAIYTLVPRRHDPAPRRAFRVERLAPISAFETLVRHGSISQLLTPEASGDLLANASNIARSVPVYALHIVRDLARLNEVVEQLLEWHSADDPPLFRQGAVGWI